MCVSSESGAQSKSQRRERKTAEIVRHWRVETDRAGDADGREEQVRMTGRGLSKDV